MHSNYIVRIIVMPKQTNRFYIMKYFAFRLFLSWAIILLAFFLGSGANFHISEWASVARVILTATLLIATLGITIHYSESKK